MDFQGYVEKNQKIIDFIKDVTPGHIDKYTGTLDYACARFNSILLKLSQDVIQADKHKNDVEECFLIIQDFYNYTLKYNNSYTIFKPFIRLILHYKGKVQIPKIKFLLEKINN